MQKIPFLQATRRVHFKKKTEQGTCKKLAIYKLKLNRPWLFALRLTDLMDTFKFHDV